VSETRLRRNGGDVEYVRVAVDGDAVVNLVRAKSASVGFRCGGFAVPRAYGELSRAVVRTSSRVCAGLPVSCWTVSVTWAA
jgi:hypothetical protein